jgi:flagellar biogenesis protein FliO
MGRSEGMRLLHGNGRRVRNKTASAPRISGLAGWVMDALSAWRGEREVLQKKLQLVETLSLGGKRELMLVTCAGESFLVGGGLDGVETIVRVQGKSPLNTLAKNLDETWE